MTEFSLEGEIKGELLAETRNKLFLLLLSSLGSLYVHSGGKGDRIGGPSGSAEDICGGE